MSAIIELRALVLRDGLVLLFQHPDGTAEIPGGTFPDDSVDIDAAMDSLLRASGIVSPDITEAFVRTVYVEDGGPRLINFYALMDWLGEPAAAGLGTLWAPPAEIARFVADVAVATAAIEILGEAPAAPAAAPLTPGLSAGARHDRGLDVLRTILGRPPIEGEATLRAAYPELTPDIVDFALADVWARPEIDRQTRSMMVVAMIAALGGKPGPLRSHLDGALNHGATPQQLVEILRMVAVYAGFPAAMEAWPIMEDVLRRRGLSREGGP